jgi:hypothetical protein
MIERDPLEGYLTVVTQRFSVNEAHAVLMRFMCRCLMIVRQLLPEIGQRALDVAGAFWLEGKGQAADLLAARVDCWNYLDAKHRNSEIKDQEDAALRAVICVLYAEPESEDFSSETVRWFAALFDRLGNYSDETKQLMTI